MQDITVRVMRIRIVSRPLQAVQGPHEPQPQCVDLHLGPPVVLVSLHSEARPPHQVNVLYGSIGRSRARPWQQSSARSLKWGC